MARKPIQITHRDLTAPTLKAKPFDAAGWIWELKHDGYRALLIKDGERLNLFTRRGNDLLSFFPEIAADLRKLPDGVIDGELVMLDEHGKPEFHQLRGRCAIKDPQRIGRAAASKPAAAFAFDLLQLRRKDLRAVPLTHAESGASKKLFQAAEQLGLEGVIGKKADSPYRAGRTPNWGSVRSGMSSPKRKRKTLYVFRGSPPRGERGWMVQMPRQEAAPKPAHDYR